MGSFQFLFVYTDDTGRAAVKVARHAQLPEIIRMLLREFDRTAHALRASQEPNELLASLEQRREQIRAWVYAGATLSREFDDLGSRLEDGPAPPEMDVKHVYDVQRKVHDAPLGAPPPPPKRPRSAAGPPDHLNL